MKKRIIILSIVITAAIASVIGLMFVYNKIFSKEYLPEDDEIALHIKLNTKEDIGLLVYDYRANNHISSGGTSNADKSLIDHNSESIMVVFNKQELNNYSDTIDFSIQFRIIMEYVTPNYENIYPESITKYTNPISWNAHFGESYYITIGGSEATGFTAVLGQ